MWNLQNAANKIDDKINENTCQFNDFAEGKSGSNLWKLINV
jgi:hypothetical protein